VAENDPYYESRRIWLPIGRSNFQFNSEFSRLFPFSPEEMSVNFSSVTSPEDLAQEEIDGLLTRCGRALQNRNTIQLSAGRGIAVCEGLLKGGERDYLLFGDCKGLGISQIEP
jgi:hypothetical protein